MSKSVVISGEHTLWSMAMPLIFLYVGYLLIATTYPFEVAPNFRDAFCRFWGSFATLSAWNVEPFHQSIYSQTTLLSINNQKALLFVPLGIIIGCVSRSSHRSRIGTLLLGLAWGGILSLFLELCQIFFIGRHASAFDFLIKSVGAACGVILALLFPMQLINGAYRVWAMLESLNIPLVGVLLFGLLPSVLFITRFPWFNFRNWDTRFMLQLANEATLNKPWLGEIYLVAIYSRDLSSEEIAQHFRLGFSPRVLGRRVWEDLVALYQFREASGQTIHDVSGCDPPLDLTYSSASPIAWLHTSNGIEISAPTIIQSQGPAQKLLTAFGVAKALSLEVWIKPANITQMGAARIVSFSGDIQNSNFMLGQYGSNVAFWLRTAMSGRRGAALHLDTRNNPLSTEPVHIVATYKNARGELYVNGEESSGGIDLTTDVIVAFASHKTLIARIAYSFFYFFPLSLLLARFGSTRAEDFRSALWLPTGVGVGLLALTEACQAMAFHRAIDLVLIGCGLLISLLAALIGAASVQGNKAQSFKSFQEVGTRY
jgi:VanZ family protein